MTDAPESTSPAKDPLVIRHLEFLGGMAAAGGWRPVTAQPEIAFSGRSNVGKSSLLNKLVRRKAFARVSKTPGRTREINFFGVNRAFVLVDLPGYGFARVSKERKSEWGTLIEAYLRDNVNLRGVVQLLDARHDPTEDDLRMFDLLAEIGVPALVVMTKIDKLTARERAKQLKTLAVRCGVDEDQVIPCSAITGEGRDDLAASLAALLDTPLDAPVPEE
ncbi:MAG: ribosome biogenesis GTP-binding protein YihA/YsxC [Gemmatimonadota bacterium]|nr:ribosome biogenesis GTP-binding protein YihA/YsxC [Gemmatimonadota bacterium]